MAGIKYSSRLIILLFLSSVVLLSAISCYYDFGEGASGSDPVSVPEITDYGAYYSDSSYHVIGISCATSGAAIRYTTNGKKPTTSSNSYSGDCSSYQTAGGLYHDGILVSVGSPVKAMGTCSGYSNSSIVSYTVQNSMYGNVATPVITDHGAYYSNFSYHVIGISCATSEATIRYTKNGTAPTSSSDFLSTGYYQTSGGSYYDGILVSVGDTVKAIGTKYGFGNSSIASYTVSSYSGTVATPLITDYGAYYSDSSKHVIGITCAGATIRYTTNGSTPTTSSGSYSSNCDNYRTTDGAYHYGILVSMGSTVKAMGTKDGFNNSGVASYMVGYCSTSAVSGYYSWSSTSSPSPDYNAYCSTNQGNSNSYSVMKVTIRQSGSFTLYIRSSAESDYDYVIVSTKNAGTVPTDDTSSTAYRFAKTSNTGTTLSSYTQVVFSSVSAGDYFYVVFRKDSIVDSGEDKGYVLLPK